MDRRHGRPDEEMFLNKPAEGGDSPTVEPLRIFKPQSPPPSSTSSPFRYPAPASSKQPTFPLPPGASSSAAMLPYPEDDDFRPPSQSSRPAYPSSGGNRYTSPVQSTSPRFDGSPTGDRRPGLAERRGTGPSPLPAALSPGSPASDDGNLFAKPLTSQQSQHPAITAANFPSYQKKPYYPPPGGHPAESIQTTHPSNRPQPSEPSFLQQPIESSMNRFASTASTSTTRASRGSPPPPETPIAEPGQLPGGGIEARYAAAGIAGSGTLNSFQSSAASQRLAHYGQQQLQPQQQPQHQQQQQQQAPPPQQQPQAAAPAPAQSRPPRPWTPTEDHGTEPHGPPQVYQGADPVPSSSNSRTPQNNGPANVSANAGAAGSNLQVSVLEQDFQRMQMAVNDPPPAYSSLTGSGGAGYPNEKQRPGAGAGAGQGPTPGAGPGAGPAGHPAMGPSQVASPQKKQADIGAGLASPALQHPGHPAFANDPRPESSSSTQKPQKPQPIITQTPSPFQGQGPSSPPPLPEGWIAHLDQNSGQYYYIHLATQATQWEFPKGPNPISHDVAPLSPAASTYGNPLASPLFGKQAAMASPMFPPQTPGYAESIMSVAASAAPTAAGFSGPPPGAGVDMYKVQPTNGVYFGPYLRYVNMDLERGAWLGSILIVTDGPQPPTIHLHKSADLSPNPRQLQPTCIYTHQRWQFLKYEIEIQMEDGPTQRWTYAVTSHLGCTRYEFIVAGKNETNWRFIAHSGNDFAASTTQAERSKLGGVGFMWKDVLQKNVDCGGFHVQLGLGDQIYGDRLWKEVPLLKQWLAMQGKDNRQKASWTARHEEDVSHAYFHFYTSHFDQPFLREAFAQIPHVCQIDDHDIFDGYGSYPEYMQTSQTFKNIGRIAIDMYLLFQHHTTLEVLRGVSHDLDLFTVTGQGWHFVKHLGPAVVVIGADVRSERNQTRVIAGPTYQGLFPKVAMLPPSVQHCIWMLAVPVVYPRLDTVETLANTFATGKKAVNTTYNMLGKVTSSVAGIVGGKDMVAQGFSSVKKAVGKSGLMGNVVNQFGELDIGEILRDMWTHESKDLERTYLIRTLQGIAHQKGIRMTFLSGDVNASGAGLVHDPSHPSDHKTMYQVITSPIVAAPAAQYILKLLHNNKAHYVPANGQKSMHEVSDTKEDMMEIFHTDASGAPRELKKLMGRRNYVAFVAYDPDQAQGLPQQPPQFQQQSGNGLDKLSLAVDFVVQGDGAFAGPTKYGPVIIPHLEFGR